MTDNFKAAVAAGWRLDHDGWWTRKLKPGDKPVKDDTQGFLLTKRQGRDDPGPYVRTCAQAVLYDKGEF